MALYNSGSVPLDLASLLVQEGTVSAEAMERALARQREMGGALDTALLELELVAVPDLQAALARLCGLPALPEEADPIAPDVRVRRVFPARVAERHGLAPLRLEGRELSLVAKSPVDLVAVDEISFMLSLHLVPYVAPEWRVQELIAQVYGTALAQRFTALARRFHGGISPVEGEAGDEDELDVEVTESEFIEPEPLAGALTEALEVAGSDAVFEEVPPEETSREPPRWSYEEAFAALEAAGTRDEVVKVVLRYTRDFFEVAALFAVSRGRVSGHEALGWEGARERCRAIQLSIDEVESLRSVAQTTGPFLGPMAGEASDLAFLKALGRASPRIVLLYPVVLRGRVVSLIYADNGEAPVSSRRLGDLLLLCAAVGGAFERILCASKRSRSEGPSPTVADPSSPPVSEPSGDPSGVMGATAAPLAELVGRLCAAQSSARDRAGLIAELVRQGPAGAAALGAAFPGPLDVGEGEAVPCEAHGPVLDALMALGSIATPYLEQLLQDVDAAKRRLATELIGRRGEPAAFLPLAERVFDAEARVAETAMAALAQVRDHPDFRPVLERFRRELAGGEPDRMARAARALAQFGDPRAVLLPAGGSPDISRGQIEK